MPIRSKSKVDQGVSHEKSGWNGFPVSERCTVALHGENRSAHSEDRSDCRGSLRAGCGWNSVYYRYSSAGNFLIPAWNVDFFLESTVSKKIEVRNRHYCGKEKRPRWLPTEWCWD